MSALLKVMLFLGFINGTLADPNFKYSWAKDGSIILLGLGLEIYGIVSVTNMEPWPENSFSTNRLLPWDRPFAGTWNSGADLASDLVLLSGAVPIGWGIWHWQQGIIGGGELLGHTLMLSEVMLLQSGLNLTVRSLRLWPRPFVLGSAGGKERLQGQAAGSFYSGHASAAFALATFTGTVYGEVKKNSPLIPWVWGVGYGLATSVAALRVMAGKHYPTDVVVGALAGSLVGWGVPALHRKNNNMVLIPRQGGVLALVSF